MELSPEVDRRKRRIRKAPIRGVCDHCGGPMILRTKGRDSRILCESCHLPPENCKCLPKAPAPNPAR